MYNQGYRPPDRQQTPLSPNPAQPSMFPQPPAAPPPQRRGNKRRAGRKMIPIALILALILVAAIAISIAVINDRHQKLVAQVEAVQGIFLPNVYVDDIHLGGMTAEEGLNAVNQQIAARQNSWNLRLMYQGHEFITLNYAILGITTSTEEAYYLVRDAYALGKEGTLQERKAQIDAVQKTPYKVYTTQTEMNDAQLNHILAQIQPQFEYAPIDAYLAYFSPELTNDPFVIQGEINGSTLDADALKKQILAMAASGQSGDLEIQPTVLKPTVTTADIRKQVSLMYKAITPIASSSTVERTNNIRVAFGKMNGVVLQPGDVFSFNQVVGARTLENGFKYAIEYVNGMEEWGIGGGVCQASTTLYLAALQSGLEIINREPHSDPVSYTIFGQDATVYYTRDRKIDLKFKNTTTGPIYITARVENVKKNTYQSVVCIYGPSLGTNVSYSLRTETVETISPPLTPTYRDDTDHTHVTYEDEEPYLYKEPREGYINETYLQRWENGVMVEETFVSRDTCKARAAVFLRGTEKR